MRGTARALALLAALAVAGVSCGGSGTNATIRDAPSTTGGSAARCPGSAPLPSPASDHGAVAATGSTVSIEASDFFFAPTCVTGLSSAGTVTLTVANRGSALHNITIQSLGIDKDVPAGQTITVEVQVGSSPLPFFCKYHRTSGMVGVLLPSDG